MKNKHFYQIFKLKIKPWIKYWLIKQTEFKGVLSDILEGISFYLTDSLNMKFKMFKIYGRTTQDGNPTPENPVPIKNTGDNVNLFDGELELGQYNGTTGEKLNNDSLYRNKNRIPVKPSTTYNFSIDGVNQNYVILEYKNNGDFIGQTTLNTSTFTTTANTGFINFRCKSADFTSDYANLKVKLEQGTHATPYSPYGCGNVNEKIEGKNKLDYTKAKPGGSTPVTLIENGFNAKGRFAGQIVVERLKKNTNYYLSYIRQIITGSITAVTIYAGTTQSTTLKNFVGNGTFNTGNNTTINIWFYVGNGTDSGEANFTNIQLEEGTVKTDYVEYKAPQNISFPLAQGQKLMEGDYPDDDEKVHHKWGEVVLDGTETGINTDGATSNYRRFTIPKSIFPNISNIALSSHFKYVANYNLDEPHFYIGTSTVYFFVLSPTATVNDFKTWLATHNVTVQYELAEETKEDFTEEQKTAWEQIKKARTYKNVTHISSEDETPALLKIQYWKEG